MQRTVRAGPLVHVPRSGRGIGGGLPGLSQTSATVKVGDVVQWTNDGTSIHSVTFDNQQVPSLDTQNGGEKYELKFLKAGTYHYVCTFHVAAGMQGTITVTGG
ncbi:MAG: hypothetical protein E6J51_00485 [Chloroflexi bacterium]|nr:MAG: hypothetical protein E6J51_00485 [Chloroflexota bacterium]